MKFEYRSFGAKVIIWTQQKKQESNKRIHKKSDLRDLFKW